MNKKCECNIIDSAEIFSKIKKYKSKLPNIVTKIIKSCRQTENICHIDSESLPSREKIIEIIHDIEKVMFPGYYGEQNLDSKTLKYYVGNEISRIFDRLSEQITRSYRHECHIKKDDKGECLHCVDIGLKKATMFLDKTNKIKKNLSLDVKAAFNSDPASKSYHEIVFSYPSIKAMTIYRIANELYKLNIPLIPRMMSEYAHSITGIDIHPGAKIGKSFFIDHGTGVVIGETTIIGNNVKIFQGVTLGALSVKSRNHFTTEKRHPTIKDNVTIYAGATILGGNTVIGKGSIIGGNVWLTESIPAQTKVTSSQPKLTKMKIIE